MQFKAKVYKLTEFVVPMLLLTAAVAFYEASGQLVGGCDPTCGTCDSTGRCVTCQPFFYYSNGACLPCGADCATCVNAQGNCSICRIGYGPVFNTPNCSQCSTTSNCATGCTQKGAGKCDLCNPGYRLESGDTVCKQCISNCRSCQTNVTYCDACFTGYGTFPVNKTCGTCSQLYCSINTCYKWGAGTCDKCDNNTYYTASHSCGPCADNCVSCVINGGFQCDVCKLGFGLTATNTCALMTTTTANGGGASTVSSADWRIIVTLASLIFGGILITFLVFCVWCSRFEPVTVLKRYRYIEDKSQ